MKKIVLYGELGRRFGKYWHLDVRTPGEAVRAIDANAPGFAQFLLDSDARGLAYRVTVGHEAVEREARLTEPFAQSETLRIVPVVVGASSPWVRILAGSMLIAASFLPTPLSPILFNVGVSLALSGVFELLSPQPRPSDTAGPQEHKPSYIFDGATNTSAQGGCVPLNYGRVLVGSTVIGMGLEAAELT